MAKDKVVAQVVSHTPYQVTVSINRESGEPLYRQIAEPLERAIMAGEIPAGELIEDEVSMAKRLEVSRPTARRALQDLATRGLISRKRGVGTRVNPSQIRRSMGLTSLDEDLRRAGFDTRTDVLSYEVLLAGPGESEALQCDPGAEVVRVRRVRWANGEPIAVLTNLMPSGIAPTLTELASAPLYESLRARGVEIAAGRQTVSARNSNEAESALLEMVPGDAVLTAKRWVYDPAGAVIEFGDHVYNPALHSLSFDSTAD